MLAGVGRERSSPGNIVGIDVDDASLRVHRRSAPLRPTVESRKDDRILSHAEGHELAFAAKLAKSFQSPLMRLRCAMSQHILGETLTRKRRGLSGQRLLRSGNLIGHRARRITLICNRKQRLAVRAIKKIDEPLLGGLRNRVNFFPVARHREQHRR